MQQQQDLNGLLQTLATLQELLLELDYQAVGHRVL
jgi:hypothetical protein